MIVGTPHPRDRGTSRGPVRTGGRLLSALLGMALIVPLLVPPPAAPQTASLSVEDWSRQESGKRGIPDGWKGQNWGSPAYDFVISLDGVGKVLHLKSQNEGSTISKEVKVDVKKFSILEWRWKVVTLPKNADSRRKETDDQAGQIYVSFPRFPSAVRSRIIGYVWDTTAPIGTVVHSAKSSLVTYVVVRSGPAETGKWITETRNVLEDYKRIYGEEPSEDVGHVSVAIDSNDVNDRAESYVGAILFRKP